MKERRQYPRQQADWLAQINIDDDIYTSPVRNLSRGGVELIRPQRWKPVLGQHYKVCLSDMNPENSLEINMRVCWLSKFSVGLSFQDLEMVERRLLDKIISDITNNPVSHAV